MRTTAEPNNVQGMLPFAPYVPSLPLMVSGNGRSGTTAVLRVCASLGLLTYHDPASTNCEEQTIQDGWLQRDPIALAGIREQRGAGWVAKFPVALAILNNQPRLLGASDCNWLCCFRDPVSQVFYDLSGGRGLPRLQRLQYRLALDRECTLGLSSAIESGRGAAAVSFEALCDPRKGAGVVSAIHEWIFGTTPTRAVLESALGEVRPGDLRYHGQA